MHKLLTIDSCTHDSAHMSKQFHVTQFKLEPTNAALDAHLPLHKLSIAFVARVLDLHSGHTYLFSQQFSVLMLGCPSLVHLGSSMIFQHMAKLQQK